MMPPKTQQEWADQLGERLGMPLAWQKQAVYDMMHIIEKLVDRIEALEKIVRERPSEKIGGTDPD